MSNYINSIYNIYANTSYDTYVGVLPAEHSVYNISIHKYTSLPVITTNVLQKYDTVAIVYISNKQTYFDPPIINSYSIQKYNTTNVVVDENIQKYQDVEINALLSKQNYIIYRDVSTQNKETYSIANEPTTTRIKLNYSIANAPVSVYIKQPYKSALQTSYVAKYRINTPIKASFTAKYEILSYQPVTATYTGLYTFSQNGLLGLTERIAGCFSPWVQVKSERKAHPHLFNTFSDERKIDYDRSYTIATTVSCIVKREIIGDNRASFYEVYEQKASDRRGIVRGFDLFNSDREGLFSSFITASDNRTSLMKAVLLNVPAERHVHTLSNYNDYRYCYAKSWHVSEFWCITHSKEKDRIATQRTAICQIEQHIFTSIRHVFFEVCCLSYNFEINPQYTDYNFKIGYSGVIGSGSGTIEDTLGSNYPGAILFENAKVVPESNTLYTLPIDMTLDNIDLLLLNKGSQKPLNCAKTSITFQQLKRYTTNTYRYEGYIIPLKEVCFMKMSFHFQNKGDMTNSEYYEELVKHGYLKVVLNGETMSTEESLVLDVPATTLVPFTVDIANVELDINDLNIKIMWAYPYKALRTNYMMFVGKR